MALRVRRLGLSSGAEGVYQRLEGPNLQTAEEILEAASRACRPPANEQLEQRVEERTSALEAANEELRREIARRERVEEDLRKQKEILQTIFDQFPVMSKLRGQA